jgi:putative ABC transport system substrate-binding protein
MIALGTAQMAIDIGRRQFISALGGAAAAWPLAVRAQQAGRLPTIGFMGTGSQAAWTPWTAAFVDRLRELGWIGAHTIAIEYRWAEGRNERFAEIAEEFVRLKVDLIVAAGLGVNAAKQATSSIPIVFALATDPIGRGLVASLARPAGNVTGLSTLSDDIVGKRLELLREIVPDFRRLAIMANVDFPDAVVEMDEVQAVAKTLSLEVARLEIRRAEDIVSAFEGLKSQSDALWVIGDPITFANRTPISKLAIGARLPTSFNFREFVEAEGLMSYGPNVPDLFRRAAEYVDKILRGAKPSELPVEQPTKFDLVVNLKTVKALGLTVPTTLLATADEVIE